MDIFVTNRLTDRLTSRLTHGQGFLYSCSSQLKISPESTVVCISPCPPSTGILNGETSMKTYYPSVAKIKQWPHFVFDVTKLLMFHGFSKIAKSSRYKIFLWLFDNNIFCLVGKTQNSVAMANLLHKSENKIVCLTYAFPVLIWKYIGNLYLPTCSSPQESCFSFP